MKRLIRHILIPLTVALLIFIGTCVLTGSDIPDMPKGIPWDKVAHFGMFFLLSAVSYFDYYRLHGGNPSKLKWFFWGFIVPVLYGVGIEFMQKYIFTWRSAEMGDLIADVLGSFVATTIAYIYIFRKEKSKKSISL